MYVDVELDTFNPSLDAIAAAITERTRAILVAHCLGNPFDVAGVAEMLGVSSRHVWRLRDRGAIVAPVQVGAAVRWERRAVLA